MSNTQNDKIWELLADYYEGNVIDEQEYEAGKKDIEIASELISRYSRDYELWCEDGEFTRLSDEQDYQQAILT